MWCFLLLFTCNYFYIACPSGYYGVKCMTKCDGHCYENKPCIIPAGYVATDVWMVGMV